MKTSLTKLSKWIMLVGVVSMSLISFDSIGQPIQLGSGTSTTGSTTPSPINIWYRSLRSQTVYTASEINAAGGVGPAAITQLGYFVASTPTYILPNFRINMKHTTLGQASIHDFGPFTTVYGPTAYMPVVGWDMLNFTTPFNWDGISNIVVETCFDPVIPTWTASGRVRYYNFGFNNFRYRRSDGSSQCNNSTFGYYYKPQVQLQMGPAGPVPPCAADVVTTVGPVPWISNEAKQLSADGGGFGGQTWESSATGPAGPYTTVGLAFGNNPTIELRSNSDEVLYFRTKRQSGPNICYSNTVRVDLDCASFITQDIYGSFNRVRIRQGATTIMDNFSGTNSLGGAVQDFKGSVSAPTLFQGEVYNMTTRISSFWTAGRVARIDWDGDDQFQTDENVYGPTANVGGEITENFVADCSSIVGSTVKMRVRSRWLGTASAAECNTFSYSYGEIEEYNVSVGPPVPTVFPSAGNMTWDGDASPNVTGVGNGAYQLGLTSYSGNIDDLEYRLGTSGSWTSLGASCAPVNLRFTVPAGNVQWQFRYKVAGSGCPAPPPVYSPIQTVDMQCQSFISIGYPCISLQSAIDDFSMENVTNNNNGCKFLSNSCLGPPPTFWGGTYSGNHQNFQAGSFNTPMPAIDVCAGGTYEMNITASSSFYAQGLAAWADFDNNGSFGAGENLFTEAPLQSTPHNVVRSILTTIPSSVPVGTQAQMRVLTVYNTTPSANACGSFYSFGSHEDYTLNVFGVAPTVGISVASRSGNSGFCPDEVSPGPCGITLTGSSNQSVVWDWTSPTGGSYSTQSVSACEDGTWKLKVHASNGCTNIIWQDVIEFIPPEITGMKSDPVEVCHAEEVTLEVKYKVPGGGGTVYGGPNAGQLTSGFYPYAPFTSYKSQVLYSASTLAASGFSAGDIDYVNFYVATNGNSIPINNFAISIGHTTLNSLTSYQSGLTTVFGPTTYNNVIGANNHAFNSSFTWNGTDNIILEICGERGGFIATPYDLCNYDFQGPMAFLGFFSTIGCAATTNVSTTYTPKTAFGRNGGLSVVWNDGQEGDEITVNPVGGPSSGNVTYSVTVTDNNTTCFDIASIDVMVQPDYALLATGPNSLDIGPDVSVSAGAVGSMLDGVWNRTYNAISFDDWLAGDNVVTGPDSYFGTVYYGDNGSIQIGSNNTLGDPASQSPFPLVVNLPDFLTGTQVNGNITVPNQGVVTIDPNVDGTDFRNIHIGEGGELILGAGQYTALDIYTGPDAKITSASGSACDVEIYVDGDIRLKNKNINVQANMMASGEGWIGPHNSIDGKLIASHLEVDNNASVTSSDCCWPAILPPPAVTTTIQLGSGSLTTGTFTPSPINIWYRSLRSQTVYTAAEINAELTAAGAPLGNGQITEFGFYVSQAPIYTLVNYRINMKHTNLAQASIHDNGPFDLVYGPTNYAPTAGGFERLTLTTPFNWDGSSNVLVETCFDPVNPTYNASGTVRYYDFGFNNFRYRRSDFSSQCNSSTFGYYYKPQAEMTLVTGVPKNAENKPSVVSNVEGVSVYPNPFSNSTTFDFTIEEAGHARLEVFNIAGSHIATLMDGEVNANSNHKVVFNGEELPTGVYFYSLTTNSKVYRGKITVAK